MYNELTGDLRLFWLNRMWMSEKTIKGHQDIYFIWKRLLFKVYEFRT